MKFIIFIALTLALCQANPIEILAGLNGTQLLNASEPFLNESIPLNITSENGSIPLVLPSENVTIIPERLVSETETIVPLRLEDTTPMSFDLSEIKPAPQPLIGEHVMLFMNKREVKSEIINETLPLVLNGSLSLENVTLVPVNGSVVLNVSSEHVVARSIVENVALPLENATLVAQNVSVENGTLLGNGTILGNETIALKLEQSVEQQAPIPQQLVGEHAMFFMNKRESEEESVESDELTTLSENFVAENVTLIPDLSQNQTNSSSFETFTNSSEILVNNSSAILNVNVETTTSFEDSLNIDTLGKNEHIYLTIDGSNKLRGQPQEHLLLFVKREVEQNSSLDQALVDLCHASNKFKYYQPHPSDVTKFVQCDPWGNFVVKSCENGTVWNTWTLTCIDAVASKSSTAEWEWINELTAVSKSFDCNLPGVDCQNDGICTKVAEGFKCVCSGNWTGDMCEVKIDLKNAYSEIISGRFNLEEFRKLLIAENKTESISFFEQFRSKLDQETFQELMNYLSLFKNGQVRYDKIINVLIEDILQNIYPDAFFLSGFNASAETVGKVVQVVPNLLSYAKYSSERYEQVFVEYVKVLNELRVILNSSWPTVSQEAFEYSKLGNLFLNKSLSFANVSVKALEIKKLSTNSSQVHWTEEQVKEKMKIEYNQTLETTNEIVKLMAEFKKNAMVEMKVKPEIRDLVLGHATFLGAQEAIKLFDSLANSSAMIWDSLVSYGFWFLTNSFIQGKL